MICQKCGNQLNEGAAFCPKCGTKTDAASGVRVRGAYENGISQTKPKKWKSKLLIGIGVFLYIIWSALLNYFGFSSFGSIGSGFIVVSILDIFCFLIILAEFICAIANKKVVFVLSIIQAIVFAVDLNLFLFLLREGILYVAFVVGFVEIPFVACILLLVGGIMLERKIS